MHYTPLSIQPLSDAQLTSVEQTAYRLLDEVGVAVRHPVAVEVLSGAGCRVDRERVLIPGDVVQWALRRVRSDFTYYSLDGSRRCPLGQGGIRFHNCGSMPFILDSETGERRPALLRDAAAGARVLDALPNVDAVLPMFCPQDVPAAIMTIASFESALHYARKPMFTPAAEKPEDVDYLVEMAAACCGGLETFRKRPTISIAVSPISPLTLSDKVAGSIIAIALAGVPFQVAPAPMLGGTGPITLAGTLALQHAEALACLVLLAAVRPGLPVLYLARMGPMNMRSAVCDWGGPEVGMSGACAVQLAHRLGLFCNAYGLATSSTRLDPQCAYQRFANAIIPALAGADVLSGVGHLETALTGSLELAVIDDEIISAIKYMARGYAVTEDSLAFDVMREVIGRDGVFLGEEHTIAQLRAGAVWMPTGLDYRVGTTDGGHLGIVERARERVRQILRGPEPEPLSVDVQRHLSEIMTRARRDLVGE